MKKKKQDYEGMYRIARSPARMAEHNAVSWQRLKQCIDANGGKADFDSMSSDVTDHEHGTKSANYPYQFVTYCIRSGWLAKIA